MITPTFDNTVGLLAKAYLNGTLAKGHCSACAVGNICAAALGRTVEVDRPSTLLDTEARWTGGGMSARWQSVFMTTVKGVQNIDEDSYKHNGWAKEQIDATGYTWQELARIEFAFETAAPGFSEEAEFAGLMAVVDVLANIHGIDLAATSAAKALFVRA